MKNKFSKWDAGGGSRSIVQGLNLFTSRNLFKSLKSILMVVALLSLSSNVWGAEKTIKFTPNAATTGSTATSYGTVNCTISEVGWTFIQYNPSNLQIKTNQSSAGSEFNFKNTSALPGKIKSVVITFSALTVSDASKLCFVGGTSAISSLSGGSAGTWNSTAKTLTWKPDATTNFTYFAFYQNGKAASGTNKLATSDAIVITYEEGSSTTYSLVGSFGTGHDWDVNADVMSGSGTVSKTMTLAANSAYEFKIVKDKKWNAGYAYGNGGAILTSISGWEFKTDAGNCRLYTGPAGDYTFTFNPTNSQVSVTYPEVSHPAAGYSYFEKYGSDTYIKPYIYTDDSHRVSDWDGSPYVGTTTTICGTTYFYFALQGCGYNNVIVRYNNAGSQTASMSATSASQKWANKDASSFSAFSTYSITFNGNGASGSMTSITNLACGANQTIPACTFTTPTDKAFDGWKANVNVTINNATVTAGTKISAGATLQNITSDITLTAQWRDLPKYTVTLKDNNTELTQEHYQSSVNLPSRTTSCAGYTFEGWSTTHVTTETSTKPTIITAGSYTPTANIELWPVFSKGNLTPTNNYARLSYTNQFESGAKYVITYSTSKALDAAEFTTNQAKTDYWFAGAGISVSNNTISNPSEGKIWTINGNNTDGYTFYTTYDDGSGIGYDDEETQDIMLYGSAYPDFEISISEYYKAYITVKTSLTGGETKYFYGTYSGDYFETSTSEGYVNLYKQQMQGSSVYIAEPECYETTITLAKGTNGKTDGTATAAKGSSTLSGYTAAVGPDHYHLLGYYDGDTKVIDASGHLVANAGSYTDGSANWQKQDAAVTLTAKWEVNSHTLTWALNGGTAGTGTITPAGPVAYGTVLQYTVNPTKVGKKFTGWNPEMISGTTTMPDNDQTYTAQWRDIVWTDYLTDCSAPDTWFLYIVGEAGKSGEMTANSKTVELEGNRNYGFKLYKNIEGDPTNQVWYTDGDGTQNPGTITVDNCSGWNFKNTTPASGNTGIRTTATGNYTFSFEIVDGYPRVSVTYPTAYQVSYEANGGSGTMNPSDYCAAGENVALPAPTFTKTDWNCIGWTANVNVTVDGETVTAGSFIPKTATTIQNINSNITLTAVWERLVISQVDEKYQVYVDGTLQLTLTANYSPDINMDATYTWTTSNSIYATVNGTGLVTGHQPMSTGEYVFVTSNFGTESNHYDIEVISAACTDWGLHYWNSDEHGQIGDKCFDIKVGDHEYRTTEFVLPSASNSERVQVLRNGVGQTHTQDWAANQIPMIGQQSKGCGWYEGDNKREFYAGQNAVGYLRIYDDSGSDNYYLAFQPIYVAVVGQNLTTTSKETQYEFHYTGKVGDDHADYETDFVQLPADYATNTDQQIYVGTKRYDNSTAPFIHDGKSAVTSIKDMRNSSMDQTLGGKWGVYQMYDNSCAVNFWVSFIRYYRLNYNLDGGAGTGDYTDKFVLPDADDRTFSLAVAPTKDGYTFLGWSVNSTTMQPGASVTLSDDVTATAIWAENFTVTYEIGGYSSSCSGSTTHYCGEKNIIVCDNLVVPTGYTFNGWTSNIEIDDKTSFKGGDKFTMPCNNVVFTADVTADEYDITYNGLEGATHSNPETYTIESAFDFVAPGERAGYTFVGWFDAETDGNHVTGIVLGSTGDVTVWAHWNTNSYSVTLNKNTEDAGSTDGSATFVYNTSAPTSYVAATRNGYDLAGYYTTQAAGGEIVLNADGSVAAGNLTNWKTDGKWTKANNDGVLFAKWKAITGIDYYVYHYKMNVDGTYPETPSEQTRGQGHTDEVKTNLNPKTYEGFVTPEHQNLTIVYGGENILRYYYERNKYELTWEGLEDATVTGEYTQGQVYHGADITYPTSVSKDGYCFMGWDSKPTTMPMAATTITAQWAAYENYRTYCGNAVTFVANGGTGEDYVVTVDADKLTNIPTVETAGFTREGYGFAGWMVNGDESKKVYAPGETINPITDGMIVNAVWISNPTINEAVPAITSTNNVGIASAQRTLTVANPDGLEATIHIAYKKNGEAVVATNSEFRFCNTGGTISESNIVSSATSIATDFTIQYKPNAYNKIDDDYTLSITVTRKGSEAIVSSAEFNLKGRSLPEKFVIAVKNSSDEWLALPANMTSACTPAGMPITVTGEGIGMTADASVAAAYSLTGHNFEDFARDSVFFKSAYNNGELWASKSGYDINDNTAAVSKSNRNNYTWGLTPTDETLISYNMANKNNGKQLRYYNDSKFGMYSGEGTIYFIAVTPREETTAVVDEWYQNKILFHLPFAMKSVSMTINGVAVPDADITIAERKIKTTGYVLYELGGDINLVAASGQVMELIIGDGSTTEYVANISIPQIIVDEVVGSTLPAKADVVVRDGGHLTIDIAEGAMAKSFNNVTIYPNSKISVPDGKYFNVKSLTFFGGIDEMNGEETNIYAPELSLKGTMKADTLIYRMRVNATHMMPVAFPYDVTISKIVREDKLDSPSWGKVGTDIRLETYNGELRAAGNRRYSDESTWTEIKEGTLTAGIGYAVAAQNRFKNYLYTILDFPMANPYKSAAATEAVKNAAVQAHDAVNWYDKGWNLMGNPYLASITGTGAIKVNETEYDFVYIPTADGEDYYQGPLVSAHILPFKDFFVQVNETGKMYFDLSKRVDAPARMLADIERTAQFSISLAGANKTDITYFKVADNFTESYDIPGDNAKMFGSAVNTKVYSLLNGEDQLAQMALNADMTAQPIQLGYIAPESGEYIFALDNTYTEYQNVEHIYLLENGEIKVDLLNAQYTFTTEAKTEDERFAILIVMKGAKMPTDLMDGLFNNDVASPKKVIYNDHFYILNTNRRVYDGTGKYINKMQENR